jgi:hypothetical protein
MKRGRLLLAAAALAGCGFSPDRLFSSSSQIEVREVGRSLYCKTPGEDAQARLLPDLRAVVDWQAQRGVTLAAKESLVQAPHVVVEMGTRPTGGYGIAVARQAELRGDLVTLQATFVSPAPGSMRTQALSTPCVLVRLPPGRYGRVEVQDPTGTVRASGGLEAPEMAPLPPGTLPDPGPPSTTPAPERAPPEPSSPSSPPSSSTPSAGT